jgi:hypothetical protein
MISRKSNIGNADWSLDSPVFRVVAWITQADNHRLAFVTLGRIWTISRNSLNAT